MMGIVILLCSLNMVLNVGVILILLEKDDRSFEIIDQLDYITRMDEQLCKLLGKRKGEQSNEDQKYTG